MLRLVINLYNTFLYAAMYFFIHLTIPLFRLYPIGMRTRCIVRNISTVLPA